MNGLVVYVYATLTFARAAWHLIREYGLRSHYKFLERPLVHMSYIGLPDVFVKGLVIVA